MTVHTFADQHNFLVYVKEIRQLTARTVSQPITFQLHLKLNWLTGLRYTCECKADTKVVVTENSEVLYDSPSSESFFSVYKLYTLKVNTENHLWTTFKIKLTHGTTVTLANAKPVPMLLLPRTAVKYYTTPCQLTFSFLSINYTR
jgi:hypothetical protein